MSAPTLPELVARAALARGAAVALRDAREQVSYAALVERVERGAAALVARGVGPESVVGLALERGVELPIAALAVLRAGGSYLPLELGHPPARNRQILAAAGAALVVSEGEAFGRERVTPGELRAASPVAIAWPAPSSRAYVLFTSGSTGAPKGVEVEHGALSALLSAMRAYSGMREDDAFLATSAFTFDVSVAELFLPLVVGASAYVAERDDVKDPERFREVFERSRPTFLQATPSGWRLLLRMGFPDARGLHAYSAGEPLDRELAGALLERVATLDNLYGPTETTVYATAARVAREGEITVGAPLPGYVCEVLDEAGAPVPDGEVGELWIGGAGVARGYLGRPELTRERFVRGGYLSGDRARRRADGALVLLGRADGQVKLRGHRVELAEIDAAIRRAPEVDAVVTVKREERLVSYFVARPEEALRGDEAFSRLFDEAYASPELADHEVAGRALSSGYLSSYTGAPFSRDELEENADTTARRLLALAPREVYEIGCGVGMIAHRLLPHVARYRGSDRSRRAVEALRPFADVWEADALDLGRVDRADLIVINSTAQYFPSAAYAFAVLDVALERLPEGGAIFVGDVRHAGRLPQLAREIERRRGVAPPETGELCFHPEAFLAWARARPTIDRVRVELREGRFDHELTQFRYDVTLWRSSRTALPALEGRAWMGAPIEGPGLVTGVLDGRLPGVDGVHPERLRARARALGLACVLAPSLGEPERFDAELRAPGEPFALDRKDRGGALDAPERYVRGRRDRAREARLARELRESLQAALPDFMVPARLVPLERLPMTSSGKIDRAALPAPEGARPELPVPFAPPHGSLERRLAGLLERVLGLAPVGLDDDFYDLGGDSISALSLALEIQRELGVEISVIGFLRRATLRALAAQIASGGGGAPPEGAIFPIAEEGAGTPLFFVHAAGGRPHLLMDLALQLRSDRPLYFVQDPAWTGKVAPAPSIEAMAARYVAELRATRPEGPYLLGGYCLGGVLALEMAQVLERQGQRVEALLLVDPSMPKVNTVGVAELLRMQLQVAGSYAPQLADQAYAALEARSARGGRLAKLALKVGERVLDEARDRREAVRRLPEDALSVLAEHGDTRSVVELMGHHLRIWAAHRPRPWTGRAAFALSTVPSPLNEGYADDLLGWRALLTGPQPEVLRVAGASHFDMGSRPQVFEVAAFLRRAMLKGE